MATVIRLSRAGAKKRPVYHVLVTDSRSPRDSKFIEKLGTFSPLMPKDSASRLVINTERTQHWLKTGALPSDRMNTLLATLGLTKAVSVADKPHKPRKKADKLTRAEKRAQAEAEAKEAAAAEAATPAAEAPAEEAPAA